MGFGEAIGIAERVNDATEIEGVGAVPTKGEAVKKAKRVIDLAVLDAESMNLLRPVSPIRDAFFWVFVLISSLRFPLFDKGRRACESKCERNGYGFQGD